VQCSADAGGSCFGGGGTTLMSATAGSTPKTLLTMAMDPGPSPVSATDASFPLEAPGQPPPINAIALSPDGNTLYFAAGTRFYSIPSTGAGAVTYVGFSEGPEDGLPTALVADSTYLYSVNNFDGTAEAQSLTQMCDPAAAARGACPVLIVEESVRVWDTIVLDADFLYTGADSNVWKSSVAAGLGELNSAVFPNGVHDTSLTGFAVGTQYAYFAEPGSDSVCSQDPATACVPTLLPNGNCCGPNVCPDVSPAHQTCVTLGYIEKAAATPFDGSTPSAVVIARNQPNAMSFALDGTSVYWTTSRCDISYIADSPQ
jgi:hypothetical protein